MDKCCVQSSDKAQKGPGVTKLPSSAKMGKASPKFAGSGIIPAPKAKKG